jgi:glycosyltransferase involved in cell wall biosynthesis
MRVGWFTHRYHPVVGGAENYGRAMVRRFVAAGHEVEVVTSDALDLWYFTNPHGKRVHEPLEEWVDGAWVRRFPVRHVPFQKYIGRLLSCAPHWPTQCRWESYMPIIPGIDRVRKPFDAVFGVGFPYTLFSLAALHAARAAGAPLILTPFLHLATPGDPVNRVYSRPHQDHLLRAAQAVVVQTSLEARAVAARGVSPERVLELGMAVDHGEVTGGDPRALRQRLGIPPERPVVGQLGVNDPNKGTTDLLRAMALLNARRPADEPVHLLLGGPSTPDFERFRADLPADTERWLSVLGPVPLDQRRAFYAAIDVFAMPSRTDSFGIVYLEAWANAKPVIGAAAGGVTEVIDHEKTGLLVPFGAVERLSGAIDELVRDPRKASRLGAAGRAHVARGFTWDDRFATLLTHTHALLAAPETVAA